MAGIYRERHPEHSVFYRVSFYYFEKFLREYEVTPDDFGAPEVSQVIKKNMVGDTGFEPVTSTV